MDSSVQEGVHGVDDFTAGLLLGRRYLGLNGKGKYKW